MGLAENINWFEFLNNASKGPFLDMFGIGGHPVLEMLAKAKERQMNNRDAIDTNAARFQSYDPYTQQYLDNYLKSLKSTGLSGMIGGNNGTLRLDDARRKTNDDVESAYRFGRWSIAE